GYRSDCTRTLTVGPGDGRFAEIYDLVLQAQLAGIAALRAGPKAGEVDAISRDLIAAAGFGEEFGHSLGHGIGLEVHELPFLRTQGEDVLEPNMVVTIEPGVYLPGWGGVRIEDMAIVEPDGCRILTSAPKARV
ncbi:MAG TPA: M24 family metallopeptidase, partial [Dehalococcoidia bacterium]|nr:M24 family metallopeptidase [Dehalococcoidia bacterium]